MNRGLNGKMNMDVFTKIIILDAKQIILALMLLAPVVAWSSDMPVVGMADSRATEPGIAEPSQPEIIVLNLEQAIALAQAADPRIAEKKHLVGVARGLLEEAIGSKSWIVDLNMFLGLAPQIRGGFFEGQDGRFDPNSLDFDGVSPWYNLEFTAVYPLYTYGKVEHYSKAAKNNIKVKQGDVRLQRANTYLDVSLAYNGFLTARGTRLLLEDAYKRLESASELIQEWLDEGEGNAKQSDLFALQTGSAVLKRYMAEAQGLENVAYAGLKLLTGVAAQTKIEIADKRIEPVEMPSGSLEEFQKRALINRAEMTQVEAGLKARRALVSAARADQYPNIYTGFGGAVAYSPLRDDTNDIAVYDPFNHGGVTPVIGLKWDWHAGVNSAKITQAQAELDAIVDKKQFAQQGIPFQVAEQFHQVQSHHKMVGELYKGARSGRRWMIASYADFEAGVEESSAVVTAFQGYVLAYSDYLKVVNDYNMHVAKLNVATGEIQ